MTLALAGLAAGMVHVLSGPDHLAAIAPYAVTDKARSWRTGVRWGLGHSAGVLGVGLLVLVARHALPVEALSAHSELGVGLALLVIGVWGMRVALRARPCGPARSPTNTSTATAARRWRSGRSTDSPAAPTCWGSCRRSRCRRTRAAAAYLLCFGAGSVAAMGAFASFVGWIAGAGRRGPVRSARCWAERCDREAVGGCWIG